MPEFEETAVEVGEAGAAPGESVEAASDAGPALEAVPQSRESAEPHPDGHADSADHKSEFDTIKNSEEVG